MSKKQQVKHLLIASLLNFLYKFGCSYLQTERYVVLYKWLYVAAQGGKDMREKEVN